MSEEIKEIIVRYTGVSNQPTFNVNGDGDHLQISMRELGKEKDEVVFTGCKFSQEEYKKRGGKEEENRFFHNFRKRRMK